MPHWAMEPIDRNKLEITTYVWNKLWNSPLTKNQMFLIAMIWLVLFATAAVANEANDAEILDILDKP